MGVLAILAVWENLFPRRVLSVPKAKRWFSNLSLAILDTVILRMAFPLAAMGMAEVAHQHRWGFFNTVPVPAGVVIAFSVVLLDLIIYLQHVLFHMLPPLWRLHRVHHADLEIDVTTGVRFHPIEILLSMGVKSIAALLLGAPPLAVLIFEIVLNSSALFNHSNIRFPVKLDGLLRLLLVTPDMHRVHHSILPQELQSNFGFNLPWWDYLFGTYRPQPAQGHIAMVIGLTNPHDEPVEDLSWMLMTPFLKQNT
jgi:sterol desaturase/sphingolipid hydroxylase (fatty acid hydroxylase superfamily)